MSSSRVWRPAKPRSRRTQRDSLTLNPTLVLKHTVPKAFAWQVAVSYLEIYNEVSIIHVPPPHRDCRMLVAYNEGKTRSLIRETFRWYETSSWRAIARTRPYTSLTFSTHCGTHDFALLFS